MTAGESLLVEFAEIQDNEDHDVVLSMDLGRAESFVNFNADIGQLTI